LILAFSGYPEMTEEEEKDFLEAEAKWEAEENRRGQVPPVREWPTIPVR
jgi:hypothetical protein